MAGKVPKRERVMNLLALLFASRRPIPFSEIAGRVIGFDDRAPIETLEKRFDRDRADLREIGISIDFVGSGEDGGYVVRRDEVFHGKIDLDPEESALLAVAARVGAAAVGEGPLHDALKGALRKLAVDIADDDAFAEARQVTVLRAQTGDPASREVLAALADAIGHSRRVRFSYLGMQDARPKVRRVSPWGVGMFHGNWYLVGFDHERGAIRSFKLPRFRGKVTADPGGPRPQDTVPEGFVITDHLPSDAEKPGESVLRVVVRVRGDAERTRLFMARQRVVVSRDGDWSVVEIETTRPWAVFSAAMSSFGDVEIVEPRELRDMVRAAVASRLLAHREGKASS